MIGRMLRKAAPAAIVPAAPPPAPSEPAAATAAEAPADDGAIAEMIALIESDLKRAQGRFGQVSDAMRRAAAASATVVGAIQNDAGSLAGETEAAKANVGRLARAIESFAAENADIERQAQTSNRLVVEAEAAGAAAMRSIGELSEAIGQIQSVVALIAEVAGQTNLLALNATIEAARAGAAGRGFAVVASEVKALSVETRRATDEISKRIALVQSTAEESIAAVGRVIGTIGEIRPATATVAASVEAQEAEIAEVGRTAGETAHFAEEVAARAGSIRTATGSAVAAGRDVEAASGAMSRAVAEMTRQLITVLRQTPQGDRRRHDRWPAALAVRFSCGGRSGRVETIDVSLGGALLAAEPGTLSRGERLRLDFDGIGAIDGQVVEVSPLGAHVAFLAAVPEALGARIAAIAAGYEVAVERARRGAAAIAELLAGALRDGAVDAATLYATEYRPIAGTDPQQYESPSLKLLERLLPPVQEAILAEDARMTFAAAVDLNGYLPVHNVKYSQAQRPGDPVWNAANARNRRIFDDRAGLLAARNRRPFLVQSYARDLGGGTVVMMQEIDAPILIGSRHWGGFRTAYRF